MKYFNEDNQYLPKERVVDSIYLLFIVLFLSLYFILTIQTGGNNMNGVFIVPTGIGAEIGGHAGDATPAAKLIASVCDKLITHPNVVNASDINEMTDNMLYVEGSILDRFLEGQIGLEETHNNKILLAVNSPTRGSSINAVSAGRVTIGIDAEIIELKTPLQMISKMENGIATGEVLGWEELVKQVSDYKFDALAIHTSITVSQEIALNYFRNGGVNPWGGVEAKASKLIADKLGKQVAHAPYIDFEYESKELFMIYDEVVDPRIAPEITSTCFLHCVLKGLNKAPKISLKDSAYWNTDIDFLITPINVFGRPHIACQKAGIQVIAVEENKTVLQDKMPDNFIIVKNYLEATGVISAKKAGVTLESVRRPIRKTKIIA